MSIDPVLIGKILDYARQHGAVFTQTNMPDFVSSLDRHAFPELWHETFNRGTTLPIVVEHLLSDPRFPGVEMAAAQEKRPRRKRRTLTRDQKKEMDTFLAGEIAPGLHKNKKRTLEFCAKNKLDWKQFYQYGRRQQKKRALLGPPLPAPPMHTVSAAATLVTAAAPRAPPAPAQTAAPPRIAAPRAPRAPASLAAAAATLARLATAAAPPSFAATVAAAPTSFADSDIVTHDVRNSLAKLEHETTDLEARVAVMETVRASRESARAAHVQRRAQLEQRHARAYSRYYKLLGLG